MQTGDGDSWIAEVERVGLRSFIKLVLTVLVLVFISIILRLVPGMDRVFLGLPVTGHSVIRGVITVILLVILFQIADQFRLIARRVTSFDDEINQTIGSIGYWIVIFVAIVFAYNGFRFLGRLLFSTAGIGDFYNIMFVVLGMIPVLIIAIHLLNIGYSLVRPDSAAVKMGYEVQSDEGRLLDIIEEYGGTVRQGHLCDATDWSSPKVSRTLTRMEKEGVIKRFQIGREKIVCFPDREPDFVRSREQNSDRQA